MKPTEIKETRKALGLTQKELADKIGCSVRSIQNWEQGERKTSGIAIKAIYRLVDVRAPRGGERTFTT